MRHQRKPFFWPLPSLNTTFPSLMQVFKGGAGKRLLFCGSHEKERATKRTSTALPRPFLTPFTFFYCSPPFDIDIFISFSLFVSFICPSSLYTHPKPSPSPSLHHHTSSPWPTQVLIWSRPCWRRYITTITRVGNDTDCLRHHTLTSCLYIFQLDDLGRHRLPLHGHK